MQNHLTIQDQYLNNLICIIIFLLLILFGCNHTDDTKSDIKNEDSKVGITIPYELSEVKVINRGYFHISSQINSGPVNGLQYITETETETEKSYTNSNGIFHYSEGEEIEFYIGDVFLGKTVAKSMLSPRDLVQGADDGTNQTATNICRLLQSLDRDGNPDNGIQIPKSISDKLKNISIDFTLSDEAFGNDYTINHLFQELNQFDIFTDGDHELISSEQAENHFNPWLIVNKNVEVTNETTNTEPIITDTPSWPTEESTQESTHNTWCRGADGILRPCPEDDSDDNEPKDDGDDNGPTGILITVHED